MDMLEWLYNALNQEDTDKNPFETKQFIKTVNEYQNKYIEETLDIDIQDEHYDALMDVITITRKNAFKVGFKTAVNLILTGKLEHE